MMGKYFCSWSGGKDCALALNRALKQSFNVKYLANMVSADGQRSRSHGIKTNVLRAQAAAIGINIFQQPAQDRDYEERFSQMLEAFKSEGLEGGVFGDIDFVPHREWVERVCVATSLTPYLPLWQESQEKLLKEFLNEGFKAVIVAVKVDKLGKEWLGRALDGVALQELEAMSRRGKVTVCGEAGEYHTLVVDGPFFKRRLEITQSKQITLKGRLFLDITGTTIHKKC